MKDVVSVSQKNYIEEQDYEWSYDSKLYDLLFGFYSEGWTEEFRKYDKELKMILKDIDKKLKGTGYYPLPRDVFKSFMVTNLHDLKAVVWGQDPYPALKKDGTPRAQGLSFSVSEDDAIPASLKNIHKEIKNDYECFEAPKDGNLEYLAKQGILFVNSSLTFCPKDPKLSLHIWKRFINLVIGIIDTNTNNCIHVLWGNNAQYIKKITKSSNILESGHPSPFSSHLFFNNHHFIKMNDILRKQGKEQINFNKDPKLKKTFVFPGMIKKEKDL